MKENAMQFRKDGTFHILQVSDPQDLVYARKAMLRMLECAYDRLQPDLVLFTGDNTLGNHLHDVAFVRRKTVNDPAVTLRKMQRALAHILEPVEQRGIPFAMIYGNHDDMNDVPKEAQFALYRAYPHCLPMNDTDARVDCDTYAIPVCTADGKPAWNLYMLDSAWNDETGQHCSIKEETVSWYQYTSDRLRQANGGVNVPSLLFLHVPLPQTKGLYAPCTAQTRGAVRDADGYFRLDPAKAQGILGESISACTDPFGLFDAIRQRGDVRAVISGHDHLNCFDGVTDGMRFIQSGAASFRCYGSRVRGVRQFILRADDPTHFETQYLTYDDLCGTQLPARLQYFWDADEMIAEKYLSLCAAACVSAAAVAVVRKRTRRRNSG